MHDTCTSGARFRERERHPLVREGAHAGYKSSRPREIDRRSGSLGADKPVVCRLPSWLRSLAPPRLSALMLV
jgi:hypothetical protein